MSLNKTQQRRVRELIRLMKQGPDSLTRESPDPFAPKGEGSDERQKYLRSGYRVWAGSWVIPELEALLPKEKQQ